ncbi:MFS transporter [Candidatus Micrarchaeota archaeon]|nr:MFS transporter [Candidatus Micrarchaeota archaeon]
MDELKKTYLSAIIYGLIAGAGSVSVPLFLDSIGYSISNIGIILGIATLISGAIGIGIGAHSDVVGRKRLLASTSVLYSLSIFALVPLKSVFTYVFSQAGAKFSSATIWNLFITRITDLTKKHERGKHLGYYTASFAIAFASAHFLAGTIFDSLGPDTVFLLISFACIVLAASTLTFREAKSEKKKHELSLDILKTRNGIANAIVCFMNGGQRSIIYGYAIYLFLAHQYSFSAAEIGFYCSIFLGVWGISSVFLGKVADRWGSMNTLVAGALINGSIWIAAAFLQSWEVFFTLMVAENLLYPLYGVSTVKISSILAHKENKGRDVSIFGYFDLLGAIAAIFVAGILAEISFSYVFLLRAAMMLFSAAVAFFFIRLGEDGGREVPYKTEGMVA